LTMKDYIDILVYVAGGVALVFGIIQFWTSIDDGLRTAIKYILGIGGAGALVYTLIRNTQGNDEWSRVAVIFILLFFNIFFWAGFEQAGGTFNLFAADNTDKMVLGMGIPASWFQSINAIFIFTIAPLFAMLWVALNKMGKEPSIPLKFTLALALLGLGFIVMHFANVSAKESLVSPMWLVSVYFFHTLGELCLSPVGLSMITKLSPPRVVSLMMGMWFASIALAQYMAGILEAILHKFELPLFPFLVGSSLIGALCLFALSPWLKKMMKGVV
jgi:proton-dependent oligopeptide transporter, POT family